MKFLCRHIARVTFPALALVAITACDGGSSPTPQPPLPTYSIGGLVSGIDAGQSVTLQDNGGDDLTVSAHGAFTFATKVASGGAYAVTVSPPTGMACTVTGGSGTASADVTSVAVVCVSNPAVSIGGSVSGLVGQGLSLTLLYPSHTGHPNQQQELQIGRNGDFVFPNLVASSHDNIVMAYAVLIGQQPFSPTQACVVRNPNIVTAGTNVTDVEIVCGEFAYVTNAADNTISAFSADAATGAIVSAGPPVTAGLSPYAMVSSADKNHLYIANSKGNDVSVLAVDPHSGALMTSPGSPVVAGSNPRVLSLYSPLIGGVHYRVSYLYVANAGSDDLFAYGVDQNTGVLTPLSPASYATGTGPSAIAIHPSGFLYTANTGGSSDISAFSIDATTGGLTPIAGSPYPSGSSVSSLAIGANYFSGANFLGGLFLYAANASGSAAAIYGFSVDPGSGVLASLPIFLTLCPNAVRSSPTDTAATCTRRSGQTSSVTSSIGTPAHSARSPVSPLPLAPMRLP
jgi:6-phosphogluconolactonase